MVMGRKLAGVEGLCWAKCTHNGHKYRTKDVQTKSALNGSECVWAATFAIPLWGADVAEDLCIEVCQRGFFGSSLVGSACIRDGAGTKEQLWLQLLNQEGHKAGEILIVYGDLSDALVNDNIESLAD